MDTVLDKPIYTKRHISIPQREVELIDKMSSKLMNYYGYTYSQLHRSLVRDEYKRRMELLWQLKWI
mgnify:CR=1 FL=1